MTKSRKMGLRLWPGGMRLDSDVHCDVNETRLAEQALRTPFNEKIDPLRARVFDVGPPQPALSH